MLSHSVTGTFIHVFEPEELPCTRSMISRSKYNIMCYCTSKCRMWQVSIRTWHISYILQDLEIKEQCIYSKLAAPTTHIFIVP